MTIDNIHSVYFIGIGGIGMSALARYFHERQAKVSGYDRTATPLTAQLEAEGIAIHYEEDLSLIDKTADVVIYTPAIPADHQELLYYRHNGYAVLKRSDMLQRITEKYFNITVAGTHGKTTTSTLIAHILRHSGRGCTAFLGGIAANYDTNFWSNNSDIAVIEADEYDRSFLKLSPSVAILTAMDPDHLDVYGTREAMEEAFMQYTRNIRPGGTLIYKKGIPHAGELQADNMIVYHLEDESADIYARNIRLEQGRYRFDVQYHDWEIRDIVLNMGGRHNVENTVAAIAASLTAGVEKDKISAAISGFKGVKRRFEFIVKNDHVVYIDDYAHHPEELRALIQGAQSLFPDSRCTTIFQPHLFSRTRDLAEGFARSLDMADEVVLLPVYPARELPLEGISSKTIIDKMKNPAKKIMSREEVLQYIKQENDRPEAGMPPWVLITAGAGNIDQMVTGIKAILTAK